MQNEYIGDVVAIILVGMLFAGLHKRTGGLRQDYQAMKHIMGNIVFYAVIEIITDLLDGMPGTGMTVVLYVLNSMLFAVNMLLGFGWVQLIASHLGYHVPRRTKAFLSGIMIAGVLVLVINVFVPVLFTLDGNVYVEDGPMYFFFVLIGMVYLGYSLGVYHICRRNGGVLKYFPVWMYVVPVLLGIVLETALSSAMIGVCNGIGISAVLVSMQQEEVFRDRLTGLYNRAYLEELKGKLAQEEKPYVSGIMLDLNGFKSINDNYGHAEGDQALVIAANLIRQAAGSHGDVIRYAGDEFVIILNSWDDEIMSTGIQRIKDIFASYNDRHEKPYQLTVSMGYARFNAGTQTVNEFLNVIDKNMYENKRRYYQDHSVDRRRIG